MDAQMEEGVGIPQVGEGARGAPWGEGEACVEPAQGVVVR